jgi:CHAD domain-containing protein
LQRKLWERHLLDRGMQAGNAFTVIGLCCLDHALSNERAIAEGDAEGVHQMRVGLRRLRAAISLFKDLAAGSGTEAVKRELKWLTGRFGQARDFDVLIEEHVRPLQANRPIGGKIDVLANYLAGKRRRGFD